MVLVLVVSSVAVVPMPAAEAAPPRTIQVQVLTAADLTADEATNRVYVTKISTEEIQVLSLSSGELIESFALPDAPRGVEISEDGSHLYVGLVNSGVVLQLNAATGEIDESYDVSAALGNKKAHNLLRVDDAIYVAGTDSYLARLDLTDGTSKRILQGFQNPSPPGLASDGEGFLYVGRSLSTVFKVDLGDPTYPIVQSGDGSWSRDVAASPSLVLTGGGHFLDAESLEFVAQRNSGKPAYNSMTNELYLAQPLSEAIRIDRYSGNKVKLLSSHYTNCHVKKTGPHDILSLKVLPSGTILLLANQGQLCFIPMLNTTATCNGLTANVVGSEGDDDFWASGKADVVVGLGGNDVLNGGQGSDTICGGPGDDVLDGGVLDDVLIGGPGDDTIKGGKDDDDYRGGSGVDTADYSESSKAVQVDLGQGVGVGEGNDTYSSVENVMGSTHDDLLIGNARANELNGWHGDDYLDGRGGNDVVKGLYSDDIVVGGRGNDDLYGGSGTDLLAGEAGADDLNGGADVDIATFELSKSGVRVSLTNGTAFGEGKDTLTSVESVIGSRFADTITGKGGFNGIAGLGGGDLLRGLGGPDNLFGGGGDDLLEGGAGPDWIEGGPGHDVIRGGSGYDVCIQGEEASACEDTSATPLSFNAGSAVRMASAAIYTRLTFGVALRRLGLVPGPG